MRQHHIFLETYHLHLWGRKYFCKAYAEMMVDRRGIWIVLKQAVDTTIKREVSVMYVRSVWKVKMIFTPAVTTWKRNKIFNELFVRLPDYPINKSRTTKQRNTLTKQKQRNIFTLNENCLINRLIAHCLVVLKHFISFLVKFIIQHKVVINFKPPSFDHFFLACLSVEVLWSNWKLRKRNEKWNWRKWNRKWSKCSKWKSRKRKRSSKILRRRWVGQWVSIEVNMNS